MSSGVPYLSAVLWTRLGLNLSAAVFLKCGVTHQQSITCTTYSLSLNLTKQRTNLSDSCINQHWAIVPYLSAVLCTRLCLNLSAAKKVVIHQQSFKYPFYSLSLTLTTQRTNISDCNFVYLHHTRHFRISWLFCGQD